MNTITHEAHPELFGLVREAPAFIAWVHSKKGWQGVAGASTKREAELLLGERDGVVLPRGVQPGERPRRAV